LTIVRVSSLLPARTITKGKHLNLSLIIIELLACFTSKQPFTDFTTLFVLAIVRAIYRRESAFTNVNKETLDTNLVHKGDRAPLKSVYLKYVTRII